MKKQPIVVNKEGLLGFKTLKEVAGSESETVIAHKEKNKATVYQLGRLLNKISTEVP